LEICEAINIS